jgi:hypothetical protein
MVLHLQTDLLLLLHQTDSLLLQVIQSHRVHEVVRRMQVGLARH